MIQALLETLGALLAALLGAEAGRRCGRWRAPWWLAGYFAPLVFLVLVGLVRRRPELELEPPWSWFMAGRRDLVILAFLVPLLLATPLARLKRRRQRAAVWAFAGTVVLAVALLPFLLPAFNRAFLESLPPEIDRDGVCLQQTSYTCGPAAAATVLRRLGLAAREGRLARLSRASQALGAPLDLLCAALEEDQPVRCQVRRLDEVAELASLTPCLAVTRYNLLVDHYVAVLEVRENEVVLGDPLEGRVVLGHAEFARLWRRLAVLVRRR